MSAGHCFHNAFIGVTVGMLVDVPDARIRVVHGRCRYRETPYRFAHAWVELGEVVGGVWVPLVCVDGGRAVIAAAASYYRAGEIMEREVFRYTRGQLVAAAMESGHSGPWAPEIRDDPELASYAGGTKELH